MFIKQQHIYLKTVSENESEIEDLNEQNKKIDMIDESEMDCLNEQNKKIVIYPIIDMIDESEIEDLNEQNKKIDIYPIIDVIDESEMGYLVIQSIQRVNPMIDQVE